VFRSRLDRPAALVDSLNHGVDPAGKSMHDRTSFLLACGAEPAAHDYDAS